MEFHKKLQELRKQKGLTQEELAEVLFVSRAAVSKWEAGRGYPNIESLKAISVYFSVTIDELLSGDVLLTIAEEDQKKNALRIRDLVFGLLDCSVALFFLLPFFGQTLNGVIFEVSLLNLTAVSQYLKIAYLAITTSIAVFGILTLALQNWQHRIWQCWKSNISLFLNIIAAFLFIISMQPYAAGFLFVYLVIKVCMLVKKH